MFLVRLLLRRRGSARCIWNDVLGVFRKKEGFFLRGGGDGRLRGCRRPCFARCLGSVYVECRTRWRVFLFQSTLRYCVSTYRVHSELAKEAHLQGLNEVVLAVEQDRTFVGAHVDVARVLKSELERRPGISTQDILLGRMQSAMTKGDCVALNDL